MQFKSQSGRFWFGCLFELALLGVAAALGWLFDWRLFGDWNWQLRDLLVGTLAVVPPLLLFFLIIKSERLLSSTRHFLETAVRPFFAGWSVPQLAVISLLAGVCEEALFRSIIQGKLTVGVGTGWSLAIASLLFGIVHCVTLEYMILAATIGLYLGWLWLSTGNLLVPMWTHALYDFVALVYFLRIHAPRGAC